MLTQKEINKLATIYLHFKKGRLQHAANRSFFFYPASSFQKEFGDDWQLKLLGKYIKVEDGYYRPSTERRAGQCRAYSFTKKGLKAIADATFISKPTSPDGRSKQYVEYYKHDEAVKLLKELYLKLRIASSKKAIDKAFSYWLSLKLFLANAHKPGENLVTYKTNVANCRQFALVPSLQTLPKKLRQKIMVGTDVDMANAHPTIILSIAKASGYKHRWLQAYVDNREEFLRQIQANCGVDRDAAKQVMLAISYGANIFSKKEGSAYRMWVEENGAIDNLPRCVKEYAAELKELKVKIIEDHAELIESWKLSSTYKNRLFSLIVQHYEATILSFMEAYFHYKDVAVQTLMFDGMLVQGDQTHLLSELEEHILIYTKGIFSFPIELKLTAEVYN